MLYSQLSIIPNVTTEVPKFVKNVKPDKMQSEDAEPSSTGVAAGQDSDANVELFPGYSTMEQFTKEGFKVLMEAIKHSNALPTGRDWSFYKTSESFTHLMANESSNVLQLMNMVMRTNNIESNIKNRDLEEKTELVVEANDMILEKVAMNIDEMNGIRKSVAQPIIIQTVSAQLPINGSWNRANDATFAVNIPSQFPGRTGNCIQLITAKNIIRPQKFFKDKPDNTSNVPWYPRITDKPNSLKPLAIFLEEFEDRQEFSHPYELELERFAPIPEQLLYEEPELPKSLAEVPLIEVDSPKGLEELVETLRSCKEFAVDLEHHSYRSFMGITCLMQISTKDKDYIIDTLTLRDKMSVLNEVFTKPSIVKIFHGADRDVEWLQRDLSLYVVNMFDTHQAAKALEYSGLSLAYLMKRFCNIVPNKQYQLADWRIRPLPEELKIYAREDTHYLIYIYQMLKNQLLMKGNRGDNILKAVIERSTEICQKRYFKPILTDDSHMDLYRRCKKLFDNRQLYALKELYGWRDHIARQEDESFGYVLPNHMLLQISETLPREMQGILACCSPIPPLVRSNALELHKIILKAREQPLVKPILKEDNKGGTSKQISKINLDSPLNCPHDLNKATDLPDNLSTLLSQTLNNDINKLLNANVELQKCASSYSIFGVSDEVEDEDNLRKSSNTEKSLSFLSPYQRYLLVRPFVQAEEDKAAAVEEEKKRKEELKLQDNRTDEDRIASVREHFLKISKQFSEDVEAKKIAEEKEMSLVQLGGSKKRKREPSPENYEFDTSCEVNNPDDSFHTPAPSGNSGAYTPNRSKKSKKKPNNWQREEDERYVDYNNSPGNWNNQQRRGGGQHKNFDKNKKPQSNRQQQQPQRLQQQSHVQQPQRGKKRKNRGGGVNSMVDPNKNVSNQPNKKFKKNKQQSDNSFVPYDYASVDFRQFQGGAGRVNPSRPMNSNYKTKGHKKMGNRGAKSATFGSSNRGRGRGRGR